MGIRNEQTLAVRALRLTDDFGVKLDRSRFNVNNWIYSIAPYLQADWPHHLFNTSEDSQRQLKVVLLNALWNEPQIEYTFLPVRWESQHLVANDRLPP